MLINRFWRFLKEKRLAVYVLGATLFSAAVVLVSYRIFSRGLVLSDKVAITPDFIKGKLLLHFGKYSDHFGIIVLGALALAFFATYCLKPNRKILLGCFIFLLVLLGVLNLRVLSLAIDNDILPQRLLPNLYVSQSHRWVQFPTDKEYLFFLQDYARGKILVVDKDWFIGRDLFAKMVVPNGVGFYEYAVVLDEARLEMLLASETQRVYIGQPDNNLSVFFVGKDYTDSNRVYMLRAKGMQIFLPEATALKYQVKLPVITSQREEEAK